MTIWRGVACGVFRLGAARGMMVGWQGTITRILMGMGRIGMTVDIITMRRRVWMRRSLLERRSTWRS
jgi:hypothetical protein